MTPSRVRFGPFEFDPATGELLRDGRVARLQRQPARLLELLLANAGRLVSRDEIRQALWGDEVHVDFERSLNFCVGKLRAALEDDAAAPRYVETVPTRGYRFIAAAEKKATDHTDATEKKATDHTDATEKKATDHTDAAEKKATDHTDATEKKATDHTDATEKKAADHTDATEKEATDHTDHTEKPVTKRTTWAIAAAMLLGLVAGFFVEFHKSAADTPKIVVVPFHNETGSPDFDRIAKGISDAAVAQLAAPEHLSHLRVIGNATDVYFSFRPRDMKAIGQALGAQYLLLGQVKKDDRHTRVIAHLIRVSDQTHVWATTFDRDTLDLAAQSAIAEAIAKAVSSRLSS